MCSSTLYDEPSTTSIDIIYRNDKVGLVLAHASLSTAGPVDEDFELNRGLSDGMGGSAQYRSRQMDKTTADEQDSCIL